MEKSSCMDMEDSWELLQDPGDSLTTAFQFGVESGKDLPAASVVDDNHYFIFPSKDREVVEKEEEELESLVEFKDIGVVEHSPPELSTREDMIMAGISPEPISSGGDGDEKYSIGTGEEEEEEEEERVDHDAKEKKHWCGLKKVWRWRLVGAAAAAAAAAATACVLAVGGRQQRNYETHSQTQRLPFQIYAGEKRIKQVVQQATRMNSALTAARGFPTTTTTMTTTTARANISFGGYYDGALIEL